MIEIVFNWSLLPISGNNYHFVDFRTAWHGRIMVFTWSFAIPISILVARFFKVTPKQNWPYQLDNKFWWHTHRYINYLSIFLTVIGIFFIWKHDQYEGISRQLHYYLGWIIALLCVIQLGSSWLRGTKGGPTAPMLDKNGKIISLFGDHYCMTPKRVLFERIHKFIGYFMWLIALTVTTLGLFIADAPRWMWFCLLVWWIGLVILFWLLQKNGFCIDTYQAIWGPDPTLPGNKVKQFVVRYPSDDIRKL